MLEFAREYPCKMFVQFSTDEVYGAAPVGTNHEEWAPIIPSNPYSASKACQEAIAISYWRTYGIPVVITNTMNLFGQMQDPEKYIARLISRIDSGEEVTVHGTERNIGSRYYLHARNMADALLFIVNNLPAHKFGEVDRPDRYNIVGDVEINNMDMAKIVATKLNKPLIYKFEDFHQTRPGHDRRYALEGTKLKDLGWQAPLDFDQSMTQYISWTLEHPLWK
jgi:dTDP-glucose 4,6-dehydratase